MLAAAGRAAVGAAFAPSGVLGGALTAAGFSAAEADAVGAASFFAEVVRLTAALAGETGLAGEAGLAAAGLAGLVGVPGLAAAGLLLLVALLLLLPAGLATLEEMRASPLVGEPLEAAGALGLRVTVAAGLTGLSLAPAAAAGGLAAAGLAPAGPERAAGSLPSCLAAAGACAPPRGQIPSAHAEPAPAVQSSSAGAHRQQCRALAPTLEAVRIATKAACEGSQA